MQNSDQHEKPLLKKEQRGYKWCQQKQQGQWGQPLVWKKAEPNGDNP